MSIEIWIPLAIAAIAPLGTYLVAARRFSGKVATTDAAGLWKEAASLRADCREQLAISAERIQNLEVRIVALENERDALLHELKMLLSRPSVGGNGM